MAKILLIQPAFAHYRLEIFDLLHKNHEITFVFIRKRATYPSNIKTNPDWKIIFLDDGLNRRFWTLKLAKLILNHKPQIIITSQNGSYQTIVSIIMGRLLSLPVILWSLSWASPHIISHRPYWKRRIREIRLKWSTRKVSAIVVSGVRSKKYNEKIAPQGMPIFIAYQSVKDQLLYAGNASNHNLIEITKYNIKILYFSRILDWKGLDILIRAFADLEKMHNSLFLMIAGEGPFQTYCESLAHDLKVRNIKFFGAVPNENACNFYRKADIFVLPNSGTKQIEGWGLVVNEAASMSLPIVTTDFTGAVGDLVIDNVNGFVVKAGSVSEMHEALEILIKNKEKREKMGQESRKLFKKINDYNRMYEGFNNAINTVLAKRQNMHI